MINLELQKLVFGDRGVFVFDRNFDGLFTSIAVNGNSVAKVLKSLLDAGFVVSNAEDLLTWNNDELRDLENSFAELMASNTKSGYIFRKTFASEAELTPYTAEEWNAILAQYSITYGWADKFNSTFNRKAVDVLDAYCAGISDEIATITNKGLKQIKIIDTDDLIEVIKEIVETPTVLRTQQIKTLENTSVDILSEAVANANITIKETLVKVMGLLKGAKLNSPLLKTATDVLRYVVGTMAHTAVEGQLNKTILKETKIRIPTSMRKVLLDNLETLGKSRGAKFLTEDMFNYDMFWKRLDKYLRYTKASVTRSKYPNYTKAIDLLYEDDRSWTFNGRYSAAKESLDYNQAIQIAAERPGFLLRNLVEFCRMTRGVNVPVKTTAVGSSKHNNSFHTLLEKNDGDKSGKTVVSDAEYFLQSDEFTHMIQRNLNPKLGWQLLETLGDPALREPMYTRTVQGVVVNYSVPIPAINEKLARIVTQKVSSALKQMLGKRNADLGKVYVAPDAIGYRLSYSGRKSTDVSYAGEFLSPGTTLDLEQVMANKGLKNPLIRLGVAWRSGEGSQRSVDIDHSVNIDGTDVYYGSPELYSNGNKLIAVSSGDITSCASNTGEFSVELVDIDVSVMKNNGMGKIFNSIIDFSGGQPIGNLECYFFFNIIEKADRIINNGRGRRQANNVTFNLATTDYAIRIDPDNAENTGSYIGVEFDIANNYIKVLNIPNKGENGAYTNARTNRDRFMRAIAEFTDRLSINDALGYVTDSTSDITEASVVISRQSAEQLQLADNVTLIHPGREGEKINKMIF